MFGEKKRTFKELQLIILNSLKSNKLTVYEIAKKNSLHFNVVKHQLILLKGQDYVKIAYQHGRFKLFEITKEGLRFLRKLKNG